MLSDALCPGTQDARELHLNWGHVSSKQQKRILDLADDVCQAFDKTPQLLVEGTSLVSPSTAKVQVPLYFLCDIFALPALDLFSFGEQRKVFS